MEKDLSIQPYLTDIGMLNQTVEQIKKDFSFFSLAVHFSGNKDTAYQELCDQILPLIRELMDKDHQKLLSLLYRVDINEKELGLTNKQEAPQHLTGLIIKRCLQKVVLRKLFS